MQPSVIVFYPFMLFIGILGRYSFLQSYDAKSIAILTSILATLTIFFVYLVKTKRTTQTTNMLVHLMLAIIIGFLAMDAKFARVKSQKITQTFQDITFTGEIKDLKTHRKGREIILSHLNSQEVPNLYQSKSIRGIETTNNDISKGDIIKVQGNIFSLPQKVYPTAYDIEGKYYFAGISGFFTPTKIEVVTKGTEKINSFLFAREYVLKVFNQITNKNARNLAIAMFLGDRSAVSETVENSMRISGITHIISISGLHISAIMMFFFYLTQTLITTLNISLAKCGRGIYLNSQKIASIFCIFGGLFYISIVGFEIVAALRSYILVTIAFLAIILGRYKDGITGVSIAASIILLFWPEQIFFASFQLSFAAVVSIINFVKVNQQIFPNSKNSKNILSTFIHKIFQTFCLSIMLQLTTLPFVLYHFNSFSIYSSFTNLIAIPLFGFLIMPFACLSLLNITFFVKCLEFFLKLLIQISDLVSNIPYSSFPVKEMPLISFILFATLLCYIFYTPLHKFKKQISITILTIATSLHILWQTPDIVINEKFVVIKNNQDGKYYASCKFYNDFLEKTWLGKLGQTKFLKLQNYTDDKSIKTCVSDDVINYINSSCNPQIKRENLSQTATKIFCKQS